MSRVRILSVRLTMLSSIALLAGCSLEEAAVPDVASDDGIAAASQSLVEASSTAVAMDFAQRGGMPHGIDGDSRIVFVTEPLDGRVAAVDRFTGKEVGSLAAPPGGFILPFSLRVPSEGHVVVLDSGGFPDPSAPAIARVYDYQYTYSPGAGLSATLTRTVRFDGLPVVFAEDVEVLPGDMRVVADSVLGQLWVIHPDGQISLGIGPESFAPEDAIPSLGPCPISPMVVDGLPFELPGGFGPGVNSLASDGAYLYFGATCAGGVHRVPIASLTDARTPHQRAADITVVTPKLGDADILHGLAFNRFDPEDTHLYAADSLRLQVIRVDVDSGEREVLAQSAPLFNFPISLHFLPPHHGVSHLVVASDQEHRFAAINAAISENMFQPPFRLTRVLVLP